MAKRDTQKTSSVQKKNVKKTVAKQPPQTVAVQKAAAPTKKAAPAKKVSPAKPAPAKKPSRGVSHTPPPAPAPQRKPTSRKPSFSKTDLKQFQLELLAMRDRIADQSGIMKNAALQRSDEINVEEDGTDSFLRLQTLGQVGTQQSIITKINEALHAINKGTYGVCDLCGDLINKERIAVLPFARNCIRCQAEVEQRTTRYGRLFR